MENKVMHDRSAADRKDFDPEILEVVNKYGYKQLFTSVGKCLRLRQSKQKICKMHYNSVARIADVPAALAARAVLAVLFVLARDRKREDLILDSSESCSDFLEKKLISKPITPGTITHLVSGRPDVTRLSKERWGFMSKQSKMGLKLDWYVFWVLSAINMLPDSLLSDRVEDDAAVDAVEPISHRHHLLQVINLVHDALEQGIHVLYDLLMMDGTGRYHTVSRLSHQGPGGIRCLHTAPSKEAVNVDHMRLIAYALQEEYGISYTDIPRLMRKSEREKLARAGVSLNSFGDMYKFMEAAQTGKSDYLYEGDMNVSLGTIKGLLEGCTTSLTNLGMLCGWRCPNTWNMITSVAKKKASWLKRLSNPRKRVKKGGTPLGYEAAKETSAIAIVGLNGLRIDKETVLRSTNDLLIPEEGVKREDLSLIDYSVIEKEINPDAFQAMVAAHKADPDLRSAAFGTGIVQYYANEAGAAVASAMDEVLPCLESFGSHFMPRKKDAATCSRTVVDDGVMEFIVPSFELSDDKHEVKTPMKCGKVRSTTILKAVEKRMLAKGPYLVFYLESLGATILSQRRCSDTFMKLIHDAVKTPIQDARRVCREHGLSIIDAVETIDVSATDIDLVARKKVLDRCRKEANVWCLPSEKDLKRMFPDMEQWLAAIAPSVWVAPVPRDKAIVLYTG